MNKVSDIKKGDRFGRFVVEKSVGHKKGRLYFLCRCDCGVIKEVRGSHLFEGYTNSCGCLRKELTKKRSVTHGMCGTGTFKSWNAMIGRCNYENNVAYKNYGGRGIRVCSRWMKFENFMEDMGIRPKGRTIDRIDNNSNYCKENCKWSTMKEQQNNKRNTKYIVYGGKKLTVSQWSDEVNIESRLIRSRIKNGWSVKKALTVSVVSPTRTNKKLLELCVV